jgi:hypothetical protein
VDTFPIVDGARCEYDDEFALVTKGVDRWQWIGEILAYDEDEPEDVLNPKQEQLVGRIRAAVAQARSHGAETLGLLLDAEWVTMVDDADMAIFSTGYDGE